VSLSQWEKLLAREGVDITTISGIDVVFCNLAREYAKSEKELFFTYFHKKNFVHYINVNSLDLGRAIYKKHFDTPERIRNYYKKGRELLDETIKETQSFKALSNPDVKELERAFIIFRKQFEIICGIYSITSWLAIEAWQSDFEKILSGLIKKNHLEKAWEKIVASAYNPWKETALTHLQQKIRDGKHIDRLVEEFQFLRSWSVVWYRPLDRSWIEDIAKNMSAGGKQKYYDTNKLVRILSPTDKEKSFLFLAPYITFFKDWRDDLRRAHSYHWTTLFEKIAEKLSVKYQDIGYLTLDEIHEALRKNTPTNEVIQRRKDFPSIITMRSASTSIEVIDRKIPQKYHKILQGVTKKETAVVIRGSIAQKGIIQGPVKIVRSHHDLKNVSDGDILVANTTHPDYLSAMQKAVAFVTNEGGIISHAAIVAREMKKPCIVGTRVATQVLKDGMLVEVDANKGIVKILKR